MRFTTHAVNCCYQYKRGYTVRSWDKVKPYSWDCWDGVISIQFARGPYLEIGPPKRMKPHAGKPFLRILRDGTYKWCRR